MLRFTLLMLFASVNLLILAQDKAKEVFDKATGMLVTSNIELSMIVNVTDDKGRLKSKSFDIFMARFGDTDKTKIIMQKPERAKGVTIVISNSLNNEGEIEVFTPANSKSRKMKATVDNMALVGVDFFMTDYSSINPEEISHKLLERVVLNNRSCYKLEIGNKTNSSADKAEMLIEEGTFKILQINMYDFEGNPISITKLSDYKAIQGLDGKVQPMHMTTEDFQTKKQSDVEIIKISPRNDFTEKDFTLESL